MKLSKKPMDDFTLGIRLAVKPFSGDKYEIKVQGRDPYRKELLIKLPEQAREHWAEGIAFIFRTLWTTSLHCIIAVDYEQWCQCMEPLDLKTLEQGLPEANFAIRVYSVPEKTPLRQNGGECSDLVNKAYRKKRNYIKALNPEFKF